MFRQCNKHCAISTAHRRRDYTGRRTGFTLLELLIALSIMVIIVSVLGGLAKAVQLSAEYGEGHTEATQHARVIMERITRMVSQATANESFPGFIVVAETVESWRFPDTLVVWHPEGSAADPDGLPRYNELVIYCVDPYSPNRLVEVTVPNDTRTVPPVTDEAAWVSAIESVRTSSWNQKVTLTELVRVCWVTEGSRSTRRGAVRFQTRLRPSAEQWVEYEDGTIDWSDLAWVQGIYGSQTGLRQAWLRMELQLMPGEVAMKNDPGGQQAIPFLGSAVLYYEMHR